jgi:DsbC/DsbD-like thiol-disulfide interchange protein
MHVYAPEQKDVIPITLKLATDESVRTQALKYPKPEKYFFAPLKETQFVYSKPFRITQPVTLAAAGQVTITGTVRYQACDDSICYLPQNVPVSWTVVVK